MQEKDLDQIMTIEEISFPSPWRRETFQSELKNNHSISIVTEWNQQITGYIIGWLIVDEIHITNIAVRPEWRRKGIAETMIRRLLAKHTSCRLVFFGSATF